GRTLNGVWIDSNFYGSVFKSLLLNPVDPELLVVAGVIHSSGAVDILPVNYVPEGTVSDSAAENNSRIVLRNENGQEIGSATFDTNYSTEIIPSRGASVTTEISPFVVKLPYSADVSVVEVESQGKVVKTILPNSALLLDTIKAIATTSYKKYPEISRRLFLAFAAEIEKINTKCINTTYKKKPMLREEERIEMCRELRATLTLNLRDAIARDLNDSLNKADPLELTKNEALQRIDSVLLRLIPNQVEEGNQSQYKLRILPYRFGRRDESILKIQSVTQGVNGKVTYNSSGYVEYIPNSKPASGDTFTVTIANSWGASVLKTVTISPRK
ncbi:MAG: Ig-like domain-containing protein, partial [Cryobacterium sp.]|nr:Ig-like domain-containing protein [Oligoflexia bacterium]